MLAKWDNKPDQVHFIIGENASNLVKAVNNGGFKDLGCFAHTLQLVVHNVSKNCERYVAICRSIVDYFKRSPLAYNQSKIIQGDLQLPLKQDTVTRWNSTYFMLQVILEQKMALAAYATEYGDVP